MSAESKVPDPCRIKREPDGKWYIYGGLDTLMKDHRYVVWGFHTRDCAAATCETLNALVIVDAMHSVVADARQDAAEMAATS